MVGGLNFVIGELGGGGYGGNGGGCWVRRNKKKRIKEIEKKKGERTGLYWSFHNY
ncbi:hypothetical protein RchiOBHm_Chr2g0104971 [Rosa chinensis]|uniref:Uncharacterized protein n=1 Tax=Rosa chinensis TaxID=74649 RepID=A0A2P6RNF8_ROSCH|nr:hypothetical protein RchiOBHm_Chr2g0104971 [Rosa chinensis]